MRLRTGFYAAAILAAACFGAPASAAVFTIDALVGGVVDAPPGVVSYVNFDNLPVGPIGGESNGITVSFTGTGQALTGPIANVAAPPVLSNNNGALFGDNSNGPDTTRYLTTGINTVTLALPGDMLYLGLLWGSVDDYNTVEFLDNGSSIGTINGLNVTAAANGDQGVNGTFYVNIESDTPFDTVVFSSTQYAFEFDNVAYAETLNVPEPATVALLGLGLCGATWVRRRRASV